MDYSLSEFNIDIAELTNQIRNTRIYKRVCPIPRGGVPVALALSSKLKIPIIDIDNTRNLRDDPAFTLIVDDISDSGRTLELHRDAGYHTAVLHVGEGLSEDIYPTYYVRKANGWVNYWWEKGDQGVEENVRRIIQYMGDDPNRPGLKETPERVARMYKELSRRYRPEEKPRLMIMDNGEDGIHYDQMLKDEGYFFSLCEHHIIPFFGQYYYGYIPDKKILGASKIGRLVDYYSSGLQTAERIVNQIVTEVQNQIQPYGQILIMKGRHLCKEMRGLKKWDSPYEVIAVRGHFLTNRNGCKDEFLARIGR